CCSILLGSQRSSASSRAIHSLVAARIPLFRAPARPALGWEIHLTGGPKDSATCRVVSVEPSSTTITSSTGTVWLKMLSMQRGKSAAALYAGTIAVTVGDGLKAASSGAADRPLLCI